jgi:hypothetical protein
MTRPTLPERGRALIVHEHQPGLGATLARELAHAAGSYVEADAAELARPEAIGWKLALRPATLIVHGMPAADDEPGRSAAKALLTAPEGPGLVFVTNGARRPAVGPHDRRFVLFDTRATLEG